MNSFKFISLILLSFVLLFSRNICAQTETMSTGSCIVNMGVTPQTNSNGLKPYGLVYDLIKNYNVPVRWCIGHNKAKDGIDFTHNGVSYKGGTFVIPAEHRTASVNACISSWQSQGVQCVTTSSPCKVEVTHNLCAVPRWALDAQYGKNACQYITNCGIPTNSCSYKTPVSLDSCDDIYVMPHGDPTWNTHGCLKDWNKNCKGAIWAGCHGASSLENLCNPNNTSQKCNFLSESNCVPFSSHNNCTPTYKHQNACHTAFQYMGSDDKAHCNGSEQIYLPSNGNWRSSTYVGCYDPKTSNSATNLCGKGFGDDTRGYVCYQSGHSLCKNNNPENVAAQRVFMNFCFMATQDKNFKVIINGTQQVMVKNTAYSLSTTVTGGITPYTYQWTSSVAGTFSPSSTSATPTFTPTAAGNAAITCVVTDACGRKSCASKCVTIKTGNQNPSAVNDTTYMNASCVSGSPATVCLSVLANDVDADGDAISISSLSNQVGGTWTYTAGGNVCFTPSANFSGTASVTYTVCDNHSTPACVTAKAVVIVGSTESHGCSSNQVYGLEVAGSGDTVLTNTGVATPDKGLGEPDGVIAEVGTGDVYVIQMSDTIAVGDTLLIYWKSLSGTSSLTIQQSINNSTYSTTTSFSTSSTSIITSKYVVRNTPSTSGALQFKILRTAGTVDIDAVDYGHWNCMSRVPNINDDNANIMEDIPSRIDVRENDDDPVSQPLTITKIVVQPSHGKVGINIDSTITYINTTDYSGIDSFSYRACNTSGYCADAWVKLNIVNDSCSAGAYKTKSSSTDTTIYISPSGDTYFYQGCNSTNNSTQTSNIIAKQCGGVTRTALQFSLSAIPSNATISKAYLNMYRNTGSCNTQVGAYYITQSWTPSQATWNKANSTTNWTTAGGKFNSTASATLNLGSTCGASKQWDITTLVNSWYKNTISNYGILLKYTNESNSNSDKFSSQENSTTSQRPKLCVTYNVPASCVSIPNRAPLANPDSAFTNSVTSANIPVLSNDGDIDGNSLTISSIVGTVSNGSASISGSNIIFTPTSGFNGTATFLYRNYDGYTYDTARVWVIVSNGGPIANRDTISTNSGTSVTRTVTTNDSDPEGNALASPVLVSLPKYGLASFFGNSLTYTPQSNYTGYDTLIYQICEASSNSCGASPLCDTAIVIIYIQNQKPTATADTKTANQCTQIGIDVTANDTDPEGGQLTVSLVTNPSHGTAIISGNTILYTSASGYTGTDTFTYRICDDGSTSLCAQAKISVTVSSTASNTKPVASDDYDTALIKSTIYVDALANDVDADGNILNISLPTSGILQPSHGTVSVFNSTMVKYIVNPTSMYTGKDSFDYIICDVQPSSSSGCNVAASKCDTGRVYITILYDSFYFINTPYDSSALGSYCTAAKVATLYAGQTIDAGTVSVGNDSSYVYVTYQTANGWSMSEVHLYVGDSASCPTSGGGNPIPGQFPYKSTFSSATYTLTVKIPVSSLPNCYIVAAHCVVNKTTGGSTQTQTGWADGSPFSGANWATYMSYCIQSCNYSLAGNVYNDTNGLRDNTVNGNGIGKASTTQLYANLLNSSNIVIRTAAVAATGSYSFSTLYNGSYTVQLSTIQGTIGSAAPATSLPTQWVNTGEYLGTGAGNDGNVNGLVAATISNTNLTNANFGIEQRPFPSSVTASSQVNPGGTTNVTVSSSLFAPFDTAGRVDTIKITSFPTNITSITINGTTYNSGNFPAAGVKIPTNTSGQPTQSITIDPFDGAVTARVSFTPYDNAGFASISGGYVDLPFTLLSLTGNVYNDTNGLRDNTLNGSGINTPSTTQVYANLLNTSNNVVATVAVATSGTYTFNNLYPANYIVQLSSAQGTVSSAAPATSLPTQWVSTGEYLGTGVGNDGTINGKVSVTINNANVYYANFGIEQRPFPSSATASSQFNPGGTTNVTVASSLFSPFDTAGRVDTIKITSFPTNATSITINGTTYSSSSFPAAGVKIPTNTSGQPTQTITIDPVDGTVTSRIKFIAYDNAGYASIDTGNVDLPFVLICLFGNVYNDTNGLRDNTINGAGINKPSTIQVYANAINSSNIVVSTAAVASNGSYFFNNLYPGTYTVQLSTNQGTVGNTPPATSLPTQWVNTGEYLGNSSGSDGTINGKVSVTINNANVYYANFGIEQRPMAMDTTTLSQVNPGGTTNVTVSPGLFVPFDTAGRVDSLAIISFPTNVTSITINGTTYTSSTFPSAGVKIPTNSVGQPSQTITIDPVNGAISVNILFKPFDNAGFPCINPWTITLPFELLSIKGNVYNDLNALVDNTVNGNGIYNPNNNQLRAYLINSSNIVVAKVNVDTNGAYIFTNQYPGSYNVYITIDNGASIGSFAPGTTLPGGWIYTGEYLGTGAGSDGTVNGKLAVTLVNTNIINANFGIEQLCIAFNKSYTGLNPNDFDNPSNNSSYPYKMVLDDATGTADVAVSGFSSAVKPGKVSGVDPEDGNYGGASGTSGLRTFVLTSLPDSANDVVIYNNGTNNIVLKPGPVNTDSSYVYWNSAATRYEIPNFNPSKLSVFMRKNNHTSFSFNYGWKDSANILGSLATYSVSAFSPLPVTWLGFTTQWIGADAKLYWSTAYELDNKYFEVQRSTNGKDYEYVSAVEALETQGTHNYSYLDVNAGKLNASTIYYRIKQVDWNGENSYSVIKTLNKTNHSTNASYSVFPNPFLTTYNIAINTNEEKNIGCVIQCIDGKVVYNARYNLRKGSNNLTMTELEAMPAGVYIITISDGHNTEIFKITKVNNY